MANIMGDNLHKLTDEESLVQYRDSEYLGSIDIDPEKEPIVTIEGLYHGKVTLQGRKNEKSVLNFVENTVPGLKKVRPLVLNSTILGVLHRLFGGTKPRHLVGKKIQLYVDHNVKAVGGGITDGVRIRPFLPKSEKYYCTECAKEVASAFGITAEEVAKRTQKKYKKVLCAECSIKANEAEKQAQKEGDVLSNESNES